MQVSDSPQWDLTGKLIIKVALGDDIRRIPIHNEDITYDELVLMMQRVYRGKLSTNDDITIKYKDEDGDLITIFDSSDLTFAIQCSRILKITLFVNSAKTVLESSHIASIRNELQNIRDRVLGLLDRMESSRLIGATQSMNITDCIVEKSDPARLNTLATSDGLKVSNAVGGKEFDPLKSQISTEEATQNKVMASFGIDNNAPSAAASTNYDRAATPDSISSVGSSSSNQVRAQQNAQQNATGYPGQQQQQQQPGMPQQSQPSQPTTQQQQQQQQQQQPQMPYTGQPGYNPNQPGQMPQSYAGQPGYGAPMPGQPNQLPQQQQQMHHPQTPSQQPHQQPPSSQQPTQPYDPAMYNAYNQNPGYQPATGQPGQGQGQPQGMYGQPGGVPMTYGQAPGMPQPQQPKAPGYPPGPQGAPPVNQSPGNPYSRGGPSYGAGYPRPATGYPQ